MAEWQKEEKAREEAEKKANPEAEDSFDDDSGFEDAEREPMKCLTSDETDDQEIKKADGI